MSRYVAFVLIGGLLLFSSAEARQPQHRGMGKRFLHGLRVTISPVSVSRAKNGDLRVARRGMNGMVSITRYRPDGTVKRLERQLVRKGSQWKQRTVAKNSKTRIRGIWRAGLERTKAVGSSPMLRGFALGFGGVFGLQALGASTFMTAIGPGIINTGVALKAPGLIFPMRKKVRLGAPAQNPNARVQEPIKY